jgi:hypothetical protein
MNSPRPSVALNACSLAAILLCMILCAVCTASVLHPWGIQGLGGLLLLPGFLGLALTQYAGTFQAKAGSADTAARLYSLGGGFMLIALACLLFSIARSGRHPSWPVIAVGGIFVLFALWGRIGSRLNRQWADELRRVEEQHDDEEYSTARRGPPLVWGTTAVVYLMATGAFYLALGPRSGENVPASATPLVLPEEASGVCYWIYAGNTVFEFSVSEQGFLAWAGPQIEQRHDEFTGLKPVENTETIPTYRAWFPGAPPPHEAVIEKGYYYQWQERSREVRYAYNVEAGRAYYCSTPR